MSGPQGLRVGARVCEVLNGSRTAAGVDIAVDAKASRRQFADRPDLIDSELDGKFTFEVPTQKAPIPFKIVAYAGTG